MTIVRVSVRAFLCCLQVQRLQEQLAAQAEQAQVQQSGRPAAPTSQGGMALQQQQKQKHQVADNATAHELKLAAARAAAWQQLTGQPGQHVMEPETWGPGNQGQRQVQGQSQVAAAQQLYDDELEAALNRQRQQVQQLQLQLERQAATHAAQLAAIQEQQAQQLQQQLAQQAQQHQAQVEHLQQQLEVQQRSHRRELAAVQQQSAARRMLSRAGLGGR